MNGNEMFVAAPKSRGKTLDPGLDLSGAEEGWSTALDS